MAGHQEKLTARQEHAIVALLTASSIAEAAEQRGIGERTLLRRLKDATFQTAYRAARRAVFQQVLIQVQQTTSMAVETFRKVMADATASPSAKVSAAKAVMEIAIKAVELEDLDARMTALEQRLKASGDQP
jgi:hypothetical protein